MKAIIVSLSLLFAFNLHADFAEAPAPKAAPQEKKQMKPVVIYSTVMCPFCVRAKDLLKQKGVKYTEYFIEKDSAKLAEMKKRTNNARTVPQIFVGDVYIGGFNELAAKDKSGELDKLLSS